jgi:hypothetical protein
MAWRHQQADAVGAATTEASGWQSQPCIECFKAWLTTARVQQQDALRLML